MHLQVMWLSWGAGTMSSIPTSCYTQLIIGRLDNVLVKSLVLMRHSCRTTDHTLAQKPYAQALRSNPTARSWDSGYYTYFPGHLLEAAVLSPGHIPGLRPFGTLSNPRRPNQSLTS
ncbi:hypothetical protein OE88DRAFT_1358810 [Heliocybe sulcata]|uniref:Secreted protein n=1 Tax=Heliocybe sulcata TaxID=5364 RepID=A0A5C3N7L7_9AGAM|nr:hypothetical protein OE88DRAFT_1358810 [Heliocybe sulcata]